MVRGSGYLPDIGLDNTLLEGSPSIMWLYYRAWSNSIENRERYIKRVKRLGNHVKGLGNGYS